MLADIASLNADGCTPLSETMYEAYLYLSGGSVQYGLTSHKSPATAFPSVMSSRQPAPNTGIYQSPLTESCQRNFIVLPDRRSADRGQQREHRRSRRLIGGTCAGTGDGRCLEEMAHYMYEHDLRPSLAGLQNVSTYTIGFGPEVSGSTLLQNTAAGAGGVFYEASDTATLTTVLTSIVRTILDFNTSFTAPAVSVNAFNRTQNLNDLYVTVFQPERDLLLGRQHQEVQPRPGRHDHGRQRRAGGRNHDRLLPHDRHKFLVDRRGRRQRDARRSGQRTAGARQPQRLQRHQHGVGADGCRQLGRDDQRGDHDRDARPRRRRSAGPRRADRLGAWRRHRRRECERLHDGRPPCDGRSDERAPGHRHLRRHGREPRTRTTASSTR